MIPSYSRMTTLLFWCLLAASLLAMAIFEFGPERRLDILSQAGLSVRAQDDRAHKGSSVATLSQGGDRPAIQCTLRSQYAYPFCELVLTLTDPEQGLDLSGFTGVRVRLDVEGQGVQAWRLYLRNYDPVYSTPADESSHKFNEVLFTSDDFGSEQDVPLNVFAPSSWWVQQYNIPLAQQRPDLHHVYAIEIASDDKMQPGNYQLQLDRLEFYGRWVRPGDFYRGLLLSWLAYGILLFLIQNLLFGDKLRKAREARRDVERGGDRLGRPAALGGLARHVDLQEHLHRLAAGARAAVQLPGQLDPVDRVDHVEQLEGVLRLVRLQVPDEVPRDGPADLGDLRARLLHPVLAERAQPGRDRLADAADVHRLRDADDQDVGGGPPAARGRAGDTLPHALEVGPDVLHGSTAILARRSAPAGTAIARSPGATPGMAQGGHVGAPHARA